MKSTDCNARSAASWSGRLAVLVSRGAHDDDPRVVEARTALAYLRGKRALTAERPILTNDLITQLTEEVTR